MCHAYLSLQAFSQPHPHLEDGTVYCQIRPTPRGSNFRQGSYYQESQSRQPNLDDSTIYRALRPTKLDKIKNFSH